MYYIVLLVIWTPSKFWILISLFWFAYFFFFGFPRTSSIIYQAFVNTTEGNFIDLQKFLTLNNLFRGDSVDGYLGNDGTVTTWQKKKQPAKTLIHLTWELLIINLLVAVVYQVVANETKVVVQREEEEAAKKAAETQAIADDAQRDLDEALPALVRG